MINYIEKGWGLQEGIMDAGFRLEENTNDEAYDHFGNQSAAIDTTVQAIIDNYDPVPYSQEKTIERIELEAAKNAALIYSFIGSTVANAISQYNMASDLYLTTIPSARNPLTGRLLAFKNIHDAAITAITDINNMTDWQLIDAYDVVNTPVWP